MDNGKFVFRNLLAKHRLFRSLINFLAMKYWTGQMGEWTVICTRLTL